MTRIGGLTILAAVALLPLLAPGAALAAKVKLSGAEEVPFISTAASGEFEFKAKRDTIEFELSYSGLEGVVLQAHIHVGQADVNGGISVFLCTNLGNGPVGTPLCPASPGSIAGVITAADVIGPTGQGILAGEFEELLAAIKAKGAYVNVHSDLFPTGEIRGALK